MTHNTREELTTIREAVFEAIGELESDNSHIAGALGEVHSALLAASSQLSLAQHHLLAEPAPISGGGRS